jgi:GTP-binding protein
MKKKHNRREGNSDDTLNTAEEMEFFTNREREHSVRWRDQRSKDVMNKMGKNRTSLSNHYKKGEKKGGTKEKKVPDAAVGSYWLPPPPFSSFSKSDVNYGSKESDGAESYSDRNIVRLPVKCLGKAGSLKDKLPLESIGLSEIAICGRSNVGKSTLLNAILYGNTNESLNPRKFQRGRTPQGAKLPKGVKAITSAKPGETKELSFYQLTSDVMARSDNEVSTDETADTAPKSKKQKQLVSKMSLLLVDLPGYGFAFAKEERTKEWQELMHHYLLERRSLKRILLLLDARHGFKQTDFDFLGNLQDGLLERNLEGKVRDMFRVSVSFSLSYTCPTTYLFYRPARENFLRYK